ncbi:uncharacterized mitochondrial protein-like protein [Tanacetum coccineum]
MESDHLSSDPGCLDSRKSTSGGIQFLGGDKLVSWSSKKQDCVSMSSAEAKNTMYCDSKGSHSHLVAISPAFPYQIPDLYRKEDRVKYLVATQSLRCLTPDDNWWFCN